MSDPASDTPGDATPLADRPYMDPALPLEARVNDLFRRLSFREKCLLSAGESQNSPPAIPRLGIPKFGMTDGPHGVSPYRSGVGPQGAPIPPEGDGTATYFPTGIQLAATWDPPLIRRVGSALAEETRAVRRYMQLGPAMNICRNPMNGRTFEYFSEDPLLSGRTGAAYVEGLQARRVAACVKHFVANNLESNRFKVNAVIPRRALEEIYLAGFKHVVRAADPWGVMSAYNKVNGTYVTESVALLRHTLKEAWGFSGVVVSDWGATRRCHGIRSLVEAGLDVEMGSRALYDVDAMVALREAGDFPEAAFDDNVRRFLRVMVRVGIFDPPGTLPPAAINTPAHQHLARECAAGGTVLLKNAGDFLPLDWEHVKRVCVLGKHADTKFGRAKLGGGSSAVLPPYEVTVREGIRRKCAGRATLVDDPADADVVVACVGLEHTHDFKGGDHENSDRLRYGLGYLLPRMVRKAAEANPNTVVVCINGTPFGVEKFVDHVPAIVEAWYGGMELGTVVADVLFGDVNPSGKLPVTWPKTKADIPTALSFLRTVLGPREVRYDEGVFVGYRYYDARGVEPRFCFGHGLSYTTFAYADLTVTPGTLTDAAPLEARLAVTNTGDRAGAEVVQVYVRDRAAKVPRPEKELRAFQKVTLAPGETREVTVTLSARDLAYFDARAGTWTLDPGEFELLVGASSRDVRLRAPFEYAGAGAFGPV